jgi:hypothetical protein
MKKYKLINNLTKEETLCDLVTIDEFDYYVNDNEIIQKDFYIDFRSDGNKLEQFKTKEDWVLVGICDSKKVITTNNPNIDIPKIINEFENLAEQDADKCEYYKHPNSDNGYYDHVEGFKAGYNKAKETYHFTVQDMLDFGKYCINNQLCKEENRYYQYWELLQIFKEQQIKTIFYEK